MAPPARSPLRLLVLALALLSARSVQALNATRVMTFNVLCSLCVGGRGPWPLRLDDLGDILQRHAPELVGLQELITDGNVAQLQAYLPTHDAVFANFTLRGFDVNYPDAAILYHRDVFEVLESGWYWLSPTPDRPSWGWTISLPRIVAWARMRDRRDGEQLVFLSTHFDNNGANKIPSATLFMNRTGEWARAGLPVIATGDFNSNINSDPYAILVEGLGDGFALQNTYDLAAAPRFDRNSDLDDDFGCAGGDSNYPSCRIDHVFVGGPAAWRVTDWLVDIREYTILPSPPPNLPYFRYHPSDHRAYVATVEF